MNPACKPIEAPALLDSVALLDSEVTVFASNLLLAAHLISKRSHVLVPSPQGDLRVVILSTLVGRRTGPFTFRCFSFAPWISSSHTASATQVSDSHRARQSCCTHLTLSAPRILAGRARVWDTAEMHTTSGRGAPFSRFFTLREDRVMRMRWIWAVSSSTPGLPDRAEGLKGGGAVVVICSDSEVKQFAMSLHIRDLTSLLQIAVCHHCKQGLEQFPTKSELDPLSHFPATWTGQRCCKWYTYMRYLDRSFESVTSSSETAHFLPLSRLGVKAERGAFAFYSPSQHSLASLSLREEV